MNGPPEDAYSRTSNLDRFAGLHTVAYALIEWLRSTFDVEVETGPRVVEDLLASSLSVHWILASSSLGDSDRGADLLRRIEGRMLPLRLVDPQTLLRLAPTEHSQGIIAVAEIPRPDWQVVERAGAEAVVVLLDAVQDPGNVGTLARTAEALGAAALVTLPGTVDPWNAKAVRAAAGSLFRLPILESGWVPAAEHLRAAGFRILASEVGGDPPPRGGGRVGLVLGNEGAGLSPEVRAGCDGSIGIPLRGRAESLNVAAAAAILLYELTQKR